MAWDPKSRHWIVERQSLSGSFVAWPIDTNRTIEDQGITNEVVARDLTWAEARTKARQWEAVRDFARDFSMGLDAEGLDYAYARGVAGKYFDAVEPEVDSTPV